MKKLLLKAKINRWIIAAYVVALIIRVVIALPLFHDWDGFVFTESAKNFLHGITPYQTVESNSPNIYPDSDLPMTEQWYGYPPLPLIMFTIPYGLFSFLGDNFTPPLQNLAIKLPFILGDLFCAFLIMKFIQNWNRSLATRASLLILFNPLLIWVSAAWGMFDIWIINFILLFLLSIRSRNMPLAGISLALAHQIKLFPLFFLPACLLYFFQIIKNKKDRAIFLGLFTATILLVDIPFFISSPQGFINQNLLMHAARPAQGIGLVAIIDYIGYIYEFNTRLAVAVGSIITLGLVVLFNLLAISFVKAKEIRLITIIFLVYLSTLIFNKVVNEQYYVVLIGLLVILTHVPIYENNIFKRKSFILLEELATFLVLIASVVLGFHFLTFLPTFISDSLLGSSTNYLVFYLSNLFPHLPLYTYPNSLWTYYNAPVTITYILLLPLLFFSSLFIIRGLKEVYQLRNNILHTIYLSIRHINIHSSYLLITFLIVLISFVLSTSISNYLKEKKALELVELIPNDSHVYSQSVDQPKVGIFYNVWWNNPSHIADHASDAWSKTTLTPLKGYYTSKNSYYVEHIEQMKQAGIDFAVVSYHLYDRQRFLTFSQYADDMNFSYAPMIESDDALGDEELRPIDPKGNPTIGYKVSLESQVSMEQAILSAVSKIKDNKNLLKIDKKPVIYIYDGHFYLPSWDYTSKIELASLVYSFYAQNTDDPYAAISSSWGVKVNSLDDMVKYYPQDIHTFNNSNKDTVKRSNDDYRRAFLVGYNNYWKTIKKIVESKIGPVYLMSTYQTPLLVQEDSVIHPDDLAKLKVFDNEFYYSLSNTWSYWKNVATPETIMEVWEKQEKDQAVRARANNWPVFLTVNPTYKDTNVRGKLGFEIPATVNGMNIYSWTWKTALENKPNYILIASWNEFFEGSAIEPSKEYGDYYLRATKEFTDTFNNNLASKEKN